ncbi:D-alanine--D-alanine ligase family protein [Ekhidna sp.]
MKNILILCGGQSPEHVISIRSTKNIIKEIDKSRYNFSIIGISKAGSWRLVREDELAEEITTQGELVSIHPGGQDFFVSNNKSIGRFDVVFPILHGPKGEDGTIQGLLCLLGIPFVGSDVLGSAASMDKDVAKRLLRDSGIKVADWILIIRGDEIPTYAEVSFLGSVVFVKPANMGSSVGVHRVTNESEWNVAIKDSLQYDRKVLVEKKVEGKELECAVLGNDHPKASGVGEVISGNFYSYEEKYASSSKATTRIPADVDLKYVDQLKATAIKAYKALGCQGMSRVDMFFQDNGEILVNEVNTIPGFTSISMYPQLWEQEGMSYSDLINELIELAIERGT